jgi:phage gp29-like protein
MNFLQKVKGLFGFGNNNQNSVILSAAPKEKKGGGLRNYIKRQFTGKADLQISKWESAIASAQNIDFPNRYQLYQLYDWAVKDTHLRSQLRTAHITVKRSDFIVQNANDKANNEKLSALFEKPWFEKYLTHALDSEFYGHSLVEFDPELDDAKEFKKIHLIPREHVRPETGEVLMRPYDQKGISYKAEPFKNWLIEIGEPDSLGLLEVASREVIWKLYGRKDWSIRSEKFGMPLVALKTSSTDEVELDKKQNMLENFGTNSWALLDDEDEITMLESKGPGGHDVYKDNIELCDKYISKLINGQTGTSDEKAFVGGAEVHERLLDDYAFARLFFLESHINFELIPFLIGHGYPLQGAKFRFVDLIKKEKTDKTAEKPKPEETKKQTVK